MPSKKYKVASLFTGIGGLELGLHHAGYVSEIMCEIDPFARNVLESRFPGVPIHDDVTTLKSLPEVDLISAGFPCQDLSQAGRKVGINGNNSGLVDHIFRLIRNSRPNKPQWVLLENVTYMLRLNKGNAIHHIIKAFEDLGYRWAYRVVDIRSFGLPQRRQRVVFLASLDENPCDVLFADNEGVPVEEAKPSQVDNDSIYGFYWTEGSRGVGWACESTPPIKGGSSIGIASPPAVWIPRKNFFGTIQISDAERLQGFDSGWTDCQLNSLLKKSQGARWKMVGNAVCVPMSKWVSERISNPGKTEISGSLIADNCIPLAAWGFKGKIFASNVTKWPINKRVTPLSRFLKDDLKPLSLRATLGFLSRAINCTNIVYSPQFLESLASHAKKMSQS
jgi:DNA (cytosine-5)-methyltransferase 1